MNTLSKVTRLEIIDHTPCTHCEGTGRIHIEGQPGDLECPACHGSKMLGRQVIFHNQKKEVSLELQDTGETLKIYIKERT